MAESSRSIARAQDLEARDIAVLVTLEAILLEVGPLMTDETYGRRAP